MLATVEEAGLRYVPAPDARMHPCIPRIRALRALVRSERPDLVYVWETWALLDAFYGVHLPMRLPILLTDMQMFAGRLLPRSVPTTFGTMELVEIARRTGIREVRLLVPPVDLESNRIDNHDVSVSSYGLGIHPDEILLVVVSRLAHTMKAESLTASDRCSRGDGTALADSPAYRRRWSGTSGPRSTRGARQQKLESGGSFFAGRLVGSEASLCSRGHCYRYGQLRAARHGVWQTGHSRWGGRVRQSPDPRVH